MRAILLTLESVDINYQIHISQHFFTLLENIGFFL